VSCTETTKHRGQCENNKPELFGGDNTSEKKCFKPNSVIGGYYKAAAYK
jgi:hypothetical protein